MKHFEVIRANAIIGMKQTSGESVLKYNMLISVV